MEEAVKLCFGGRDDHQEEAVVANDSIPDRKLSQMMLAEIRRVLHPVDENDTSVETQRRQREALESLSQLLQPSHIKALDRRIFVQEALTTGVVDKAAELVEFGSVPLATAACNFLGDFAFDSDAGARAALNVFDRMFNRFVSVLSPLNWEHMSLLEAAILLCVNIAATCPSGHPRLIPLVRPVCLQIIQNARASQILRGNTILLLANLSMTVSQELRSLGVAEVLLDLVLGVKDATQNSVAESVIIFLHGDHKCEVMDKLMDLHIVSEYCVKIMQVTMMGEEFRGMYPHLMYSARLFQVMAQCREYAEALVSNTDVVPLLLEANRSRGEPVRVESDLEGRRLALEALGSLVAHGLLWPLEDEQSREFILKDLPLLLNDEHAGIRAASANLWGRLHSEEVWAFFLVGNRLQFPRRLWTFKVLTFLLPCLGNDCDTSSPWVPMSENV